MLHGRGKEDTLTHRVKRNIGHGKFAKKKETETQKLGPMAMYHHQLQPLDQQWDAVDMRYENCSQTGSKTLWKEPSRRHMREETSERRQQMQMFT